MIELYVRIEIRRNIFWNTNLKLVLTGFISNELERNSCPIIKPIIIEKKTKDYKKIQKNLYKYTFSRTPNYEKLFYKIKND